MSDLVSDEALRLAERAARKAKNRDTPIRSRFVQRPDTDSPEPPLARLLRGGQGGEVRLKVYLAMLWIAAGDGHAVEFAAHDYARLLDLDDPYKNGARRVNDALRRLAANGLILLERRPGREPVATLLSDDGSRRPYGKPGTAEKNPDTKKAYPENVYFKLPVGFWTNGWAVHCPGPAMAMLLVLLDQSRSKGKDNIWIAPSRLKETYCFSDDTRSRGIEVLEDTALVFIRRMPVSEEFGYRRVRNSYSLDPSLLSTPVKRGAKEEWQLYQDIFEERRHEAWSNYVQVRVKMASGELVIPQT